jgi:tRNA (mo5U34)-methyltransferase
MPSQAIPDPVDAEESYRRETREFNEQISQSEHTEARNFFWYHTVDLGEGLVTPGLYDFRGSLAPFGFPADMSGMTALDVGSATGFFAFEFEKRGARVISVETPSLAALDRFPGQTVEQAVEKIRAMIFPSERGTRADAGPACSAEELYLWLLKGPFEFCHGRLGSRVERRLATIYELSPETVGVAQCDLVFLGDILLHTLHPLEALAAVAPLCSGTLVLSQVMPEVAEERPAMLYVGGDDPQADEISWWWPNQACLTHLLKKLGFRDVVEAGKHQGVLRSTGHRYERTVLHAIKPGGPRRA